MVEGIGDCGSALRDLSTCRRGGPETFGGWSRCNGYRRIADGSPPLNRRELSNSRVGQGSRLPRPPTDPDVRNSRIRLFRLRVRCVMVPRMHRCGGRQRESGKQPIECLPVQTTALGTTRQPLAPNPVQVVTKSPEASRVPGDPVVRAMPAEFLDQLSMLPDNRLVAVAAAPEVYGL